MTALWRINLWVTLFFTLVAALGMLLLLRQASTDVQREMRAAQAMVDYLHVAASRDPASLHSGLAGNLRHIRITPLINPELTPPTRQDWLATQLLAELPAILHEYDVVVSSTASQLPVVGKGMVERALRQRHHMPVFMLDLAVPRDIE